MSAYESLKAKKNECIDNAIKAEDEDMYRFWCNAAAGYQRRIDRMTIEEASEEA